MAREVEAETEADQHLTNTIIFKYEDGHVTMALLAISKFKGASEDGYYKLSSRWQGDDLSIRFPNGAWEEFASFRSGHFELLGDGIRREFERITPEQVEPRHLGLIKTGREVFEYPADSHQ